MGCNSTMVHRDGSVEPCKEETSEVVLFGLFVMCGICLIVVSWTMCTARKAEIQLRRQAEQERAEMRERNIELGQIGLDKAAIEALPLVMFKDVPQHRIKEILICSRELQIRPAETFPKVVRRRSSAGFKQNNLDDKTTYSMDVIVPFTVVSPSAEAVKPEDDITINSVEDSAISMSPEPDHHHGRGERKQSEDFNEISCSICLDTLEPSDMVRLLPCKHLFHGSCVDSWFERSELCPLCKQCPTSL